VRCEQVTTQRHSTIVAHAAAKSLAVGRHDPPRLEACAATKLRKTTEPLAGALDLVLPVVALRVARAVELGVSPPMAAAERAPARRRHAPQRARAPPQRSVSHRRP
jgi:hypothetical protein